MITIHKKRILVIACLVGGAILFYWTLQNLPTIGRFLGTIGSPLTPLLIGAAIAFILNIPMQALENKLLKKSGPKLRRGVCLMLTLLLGFGLILLAFLIVIPEIGQTFETLFAKLPGLIANITAWGQELSAKYPNLGIWISSIELDWSRIGENLFNWLKSGGASAMNSVVHFTSSIFGAIINFLLGFVFAIYILFQKETLARQFKRGLSAFLSKTRADNFLRLCTLGKQTFTNFITGQSKEAVILGLMFFVALSLFRFPYAMVIAVLITGAAFIPIFGALLACSLGVLLILVTSPEKVIWFIVLFLVLQQIEGNLIYPRIVGKSVGLPALWVMTAVLIGGGLMGITGMLLSVPLGSIFYVMLRETVNRRLAKNQTTPAEKSSAENLADPS